MASAQESTLGRSIYERNSDSVVLLLARDSSGVDVALGSAFWAAPKVLVTNAHVVEAGKIFAKLGPVRLPCTVVAVDHHNDLATLTVDAEVVAIPVKLSATPPKPGDVVFVIGNPEGLEKAISQGIVSGIRKVDGQEFIQITAAISHGSSGGPVFDGKGEVIGVTVGMLDSGQNLNFAIPVRFVSEILNNKQPATGRDSAMVLARLQNAVDTLSKFEYSTSPDSEYQKSLTAFKTLARNAVNEVGNDANAQLRISELSRWMDADIAVDAARRACTIKPSVEAHLAVAQALQFQSWYLKDAEKANVLAEAEQHARSAVTLTTRSPNYKTFYALADVQEDRSELSASQQSFKKALALANTSEERSDVYRALLRISTAEGSTQEAEQWFQKLSATGLDRALDWESEGSRLYDQHKYKEAGDAYYKAAAKGLIKDSCYAATDYFISGADDASLSAARLCISDNTGKPNTDKMLSGAHWFIASVLNKRGVYGEALSHAKEASVLDPKDASNFDTVAQALIGLQRPHEAAEASDQAIRLSDGGVAQYHFTLGSAYFDMENWQLARQSYEKAAELNPKDPASAYNVALCLSKQQHFMDAAHWYEEYLRRNPDAKDKADILNRIQILKR